MSSVATHASAPHGGSRALLIYFALAFFVPWTVVLAIVALGQSPGTNEPGGVAFLFVFISMALAPAGAGLLMTAVVRGKRGLARLFTSLLDLRALVRPETLLVLLAPAAAALVLAAFSASSEAFLPGFLTAPDGLALLAMGIGLGIFAGIFEETGWTGFATTELLTRGGVVKVGLLVGSIHGLWHLAAGYWSEGPSYGAYYIPYFLVAWIAGLTVLRLLIVWLYRRTGSLLLAALTHAGYTGGLLILWPTNTQPVQTIAWTGCFVLLFAVPVIVLLRSGGQSGGAPAAASPRQPG